MFLKQSAAAILTGVVTAMVVSGALPMLEAAFRITTDMSWLEMADRNHPLLLRLSLEAPGTGTTATWWQIWRSGCQQDRSRGPGSISRRIAS
jgi:hypothetical protein